MRQLAPMLVTLTLLISLGSARADETTVAGLMVSTNIDRAVTTFAGDALTLVTKAQISDAKPFIAHWQASAAQALDGDAMEAELVSAVAAAVSDADEAALADFYSSELGEEIARIERATTELSSDQLEAAIAAGRELRNAASADRLALLAELDTTAMAGINHQLLVESMRAAMAGMALAGQPGAGPVPWDAIAQQIDATVPALERDASERNRSLAAKVYETLSDDELETYVAALEAPAGEHFYAATVTALSDMLHRRITSFGNVLAGRLHSIGV